MTRWELELIKHGNRYGFSNRTIARQIGCHHNTVSYWLKKLGLKSSWASQKIQYVGKDKAKCSKCREIKSLKEFQHGRKGQQYEYKFSYCIACRKKQSYLNLNKNKESFLKDKFNRLKLRAGKKRIKFNLTFKYFYETFSNQKGLCFYTDVPLICKVGSGKHRNSCSVDRVIFDKGYVKGNIVFCANRINTAKSDFTLEELKIWMPKWYKRIQRYVNRRD
jgi:hypothetical protein